MHSRAVGTPFRRARRTSRQGLVAALAALALIAPATPVFAAPAPGPADPGPTSAWGRKTDFDVPPVKVGETKPVPGEAEAEPTKEQAAWRAEQKERARTGETPKPAASSRSAAADAATTVYVPEDQGAVPWHQISDFRITDSLVARINLSTGNLMLAATDFEIAGVGQKLRLARTYNSFDAPWGKVSQRWWQEYERYLRFFSGEVILYDSTGATVSFTENADGTFTTPKGYSKDLRKNADGTYTLTDRKSGSKDTYDEYGTLTEVTDKNHGVIRVDQHDEGSEHKGFKITETRSGRWIDLVKTYGDQWQAKDHTGRTAVFDLNAAGDLAKTTDTEGKSTVFGYDSSRRLTKITTPEGRVTVFTYDDDNRVRSMLRATEFDAAAGHTGPTYTYAYSNADPSAAGTTTVTDPEQHATKYEHNADGGVTKVTDALNHTRKRTFDANHNIDTAEDAMGVGGGAGNVTAYGWDSRNNPTSARLPTGATATLTGYQTIAGADLPGTFTSADGEKTDYTYDTAGNTKSVAVTGTGGGKRTFDYNPATPTCDGFEGQVCKVTTTMSATRSVSTSFDYDAKGNLSKVDPPAPLGDTTYTYDALGRPETVTDGRGVKTVYTYDNRDRIVEVSSTNDTVRYHYDGDGNLRQRDDGTGVTKYAFDPLSRETVRTLQNGSQTRITYTPAGNIDTYQDPSGVTDYTWNEVNKLTALKDPTGRTTTYEYNANDFRTTTTYPGGTVQEVTPDGSSRPERIKATSPRGTLVDLTYSYAAAGTDGARIRTRTDAVTGLRTTYTYDGAGRFSYAKEEKGTTLNSSWQYCYDQAGNLTSQGVEQGCPRGTTYTVNDAQQITAKNGSSTNWSYDPIGNETAGASTPEGTRTGEVWSDYSQMTSITVGGRTYAGQYGSTDQSERIKLGDTFFHNGPLGLSAKTTAGVDMGFNREPGGTLNSMTTGGKSYYYLTDAIGSVVALADETGTKVNTYAYSPRGVERSTTTEKVPQPYRFAGGYQDPTGLYHFSARYYDPNIGRFTSPDPSGQEKNPYLYAEGDPVNRIDPQGLLSFDIGGEACFWVCGGAGVSINEDGSLHPYVSAGVGTPGGSVDASLASGSADQGWTGEVACGFGPFDVSVATDGSEGVGTGGSTGKCSGTAKYTF
ncbi:RHS repeat-associated core domain-containing protein [Streptomyces sp. NPDC126497]|uniref:RHS repeat-associated core domain-containing protein n=1 Tax=Streptomyces sp. NPDC126497 TaxID=3155313 RepID=UPI0033322EC1